VRRIDLNVDIGEGFPHDEQLLLFASSANICCGAHAGSWEMTQQTIGLALDAGARIGMHPGYPDRASMGRAGMPPSSEIEFQRSISAQVEQFFNFVPAAYLKPHGAFYNESAHLGHPAYGLLQSVASRFRLAVMGLPGTAHAMAGTDFIAEGFADRGYTPDGLLIPRGTTGALLEDPADVQRQVLSLAPKVQTICLHGDTPNCLDFAELVYKTLLDAGYEVGADC
jgi:UPF0271 protein